MDKELSLIPFPTNKIFDRLHTFDVVIFRTLIIAPSTWLIFFQTSERRFAKAWAYQVGGPQSFDGGGYARTAINDIARPNEFQWV